MKLLQMLATTGTMAIATAAAGDEAFITIGTAGQTGVYYVVGQSICRLVNQSSEENNLKCTAPSTGASVANINAIKSGDMGMGLAQSDTQFDAYNGSGSFEGEKYDNLRSVFSIHGEPFTVVARADIGIATFEDLKGKRVNVGNAGAGSLATMEVVMEALGWTMKDFALASQLKAAEQSAALGDNKVDAIIYTVGHPNGSIQEATSVTDARIIAVEGPAIDELVEDNPYYGGSPGLHGARSAEEGRGNPSPPSSARPCVGEPAVPKTDTRPSRVAHQTGGVWLVQIPPEA